MKHSFNCLSYELLLYVLICIPFCSCSQKDTGVISPNGKICLSVEIKEDTEKDGFGKVFFNVEYKDGKTSRRVLSFSGLTMTGLYFDIAYHLFKIRIV